MELFRKQSPTPTLSVEENTLFLPFGNATLKDVDLTELYTKDQVEEIVSQDIIFKGINGTISVLADPGGFDAEFLTPLGEVRLVQSAQDGKHKVMESPGYLTVEFTVTSQEQFDAIRDYEAVVYMNDEVLYMNCINDTSPEFAFHELSSGRHLFIQTDKMTDKKGSEVFCMLPTDSRLRGIRMKLAEYDEDDDDDVAYSPTPSPFVGLVS